MSKAARRKEQNRAAQKAFRERREARVTDVSRGLKDWSRRTTDATARSQGRRARRQIVQLNCGE
jgi:AP-1-like factor